MMQSLVSRIVGWILVDIAGRAVTGDLVPVLRTVTPRDSQHTRGGCPYQGTEPTSLKNPPLGPSSGSVASVTTI